MTTGGAPLRARPWLEWAGPVLLAGWFLGTAVLGVAARYRAADLTLLAGVYLLLGLVVHQGAALLRRLFGLAGGWSAAFLLALTALWQLREQTFLPGSIPLTLAAAGVLTAPAYWLFLAALPRRRWTVRLIATVGSVLALVLLVVAAARASETFRWHLLRHNTLLGTPYYYLFEEPVAEMQEALFAAHGIQAPLTEGDAPAAAAAPGNPPNLVFAMLDTLRADALAGWGGDPELMPWLNTYLEDAVRFTDVWANSSWTRPSMASFFTGLLPEEHGARGVDDALGPGFTTLAESLRARGYRTVAFTTNLAATGRGAGFAQGFDTFVELQGDPYARAERVRRVVTGWLEQEDPEAPVFLYLHFLDPHEPYLAGDAPGSMRPGPYLQAYRNELRYLDDELARLLPLVEAGLPGPDAVFVASDHGEELFEHELFGHGQSLFREVIHVPVALKLPAGSGGPVSAPLEARDFHDLLLEVASSSPPDPVAWVRAHARERRYASLYYSTTGRLILRPYLRRVALRAVQEGDDKLVWSAYGDTRELYDLARDPGETENLAAERPQRVRELERAMEEAVDRWVRGAPIEASDAEREQLKALGYVD